MVKVFIKKQGDSVTVSNLHMPESKMMEITDAEHEKLNDGEHTFDLKGETLEITKMEKVESSKQTAKRELKEKLEAGTATDMDIKEGLKLLL